MDKKKIDRSKKYRVGKPKEEEDLCSPPLPPLTEEEWRKEVSKLDFKRYGKLRIPGSEEDMKKVIKICINEKSTLVDVKSSVIKKDYWGVTFTQKGSLHLYFANGRRVFLETGRRWGNDFFWKNWGKVVSNLYLLGIPVADELARRKNVAPNWKKNIKLVFYLTGLGLPNDLIHFNLRQFLTDF